MQMWHGMLTAECVYLNVVCSGANILKKLHTAKNWRILTSWKQWHKYQQSSQNVADNCRKEGKEKWNKARMSMFRLEWMSKWMNEWKRKKHAISQSP